MKRSRKVRLAWLAAVALMAVAVQTRPRAQPHEARTPVASRTTVPGVPLFFVPNQGQSDPAVRFQARALGGAAFFTANDVVLALPQPGGVAAPDRASLGGDPRSAALGAERGVPIKFVRLRFVGASAALRVEGAARLPALVHEFRGGRASRHVNLPTYASVVYRNLYEGVDQREAGLGDVHRAVARSRPVVQLATGARVGGCVAQSESSAGQHDDESRVHAEREHCRGWRRHHRDATMTGRSGRLV